jgi:dolichol kinase
LHVGLADGFAAVVGTTYGKNNQYKVFGQTKSLAGTATFYIFSLLITTAVVVLDHGAFASPLLIVLLMPPLATALENVGIYGSDNLILPLFVATFLAYFQVAA